MKNIEIENSKQKIGFFGPMKPFNSAKTFFEKTSNGGLKATIHHSPMKGVSVKHLRWKYNLQWFRFQWPRSSKVSSLAPSRPN